MNSHLASMLPVSSAPSSTVKDAPGATPLPELQVISVSGDDARSFLQNQLTNDLLQLGTSQAQLNGYCSPKGRLLATFLTWTDGSTIYLALPADLLEPLRKRLSMYVLRAKVKLEAAALSLLGFHGVQVEAPLQAVFGSLPQTAWASSITPHGTVIRTLDALAQPRWLVCVSSHDNLLDHAAFKDLPRSTSELWRALDIRAGLPWVVAATQDKFVPQMINFEALGGVNFRKGCFPGQEIVARSQYLGKLKRRTWPATLQAGSGAADTDPAPQPGADVLGVDGSPIGLVVNAAATSLGTSAGASRATWDLLVELPVDLTDAERSALRLTADGAPLVMLELPYVLPDNEVFVRPKL